MRPTTCPMATLNIPQAPRGRLTLASLGIGILMELRHGQ